MIRPSALPVVFALFAASAAFAQERPAPPPLPLQECVDRALNKNFDLKIQRFSIQSARDDVIVADAGYDPTLALSAGMAGSKNANASPTQTSAQTSSRFSVVQPVITGASLTVGTSLDRSREKPYSAPPLYNPVYNSDVTFTVTQPLLKGAGITINRAAINRAKLGITRANLDFKNVVLTVVREVEGAYYNLAFAREQRDVYRFSLGVAQKLLEENKARRTAGVATELDVLQAEVGVANARRNLLLADQTVRNSEDALLQLIGQFEFSTAPGAIQLVEEPVPDVSFDHSYALALANEPAYASGKTLVEQLKLDVLTAKNNRLPSIDLSGALGYNSKDSTTASGALGNAWSGDGYNWEVDLTLSFPWGLRAENARYRQSLASVGQQETSLRQLDQNILVQVRAAVLAVATNRESVSISALATRLSEKQFESEKARYEAGLSTFRFVQQSQADLDTARVNELQARVNLRLSLADLARLETSSLERYKITLAE
ncbi:MAG: TolC family protein [Verrucomicrobia bacterium]|nr:TolC family protein [Verrucomicrobiota bacterium]